MALIVEDGTGLSTADALVSLAYVDAYHTAQGNSTWTGDDVAVKEPAIRRASAFLTNAYGWKGYPVNGRSQALAWPRTYVEDAQGYSVPSNEVPAEVQKACAEIALRELVTPGQMTPDYTPQDRVKSERFGSVSFEYDMSRTDADAARPVLLIVRDLIGGLLNTGAQSRLVGSVVRR